MPWQITNEQLDPMTFTLENGTVTRVPGQETVTVASPVILITYHQLSYRRNGVWPFLDGQALRTRYPGGNNVEIYNPTTHVTAVYPHDAQTSNRNLKEKHMPNPNTPSIALSSENYTVTWLENSQSVAAHKQAGQYTAVSRQVTGSSNHVTWFTFQPNQSVISKWKEQFFAYQSSTDIQSGVTITGFNSAAVNLGGWYQFSDDTNSWSPMTSPPSGQPSVPTDSVGLYYKVSSGESKQTTFGLQCKVEGAKAATAICADTIFSNQPVVYTPLTTLYARMGKEYKTNTVIASIGNWNTLRFPGTTATAQYNDGQNSWELQGSSNTSAHMMELLLQAHVELCNAHTALIQTVLKES